MKFAIIALTAAAVNGAISNNDVDMSAMKMKSDKEFATAKNKFEDMFGWAMIKRKDFEVPDHNNSLNGMIYNFTKAQKTFYNFYYYS